MFLAEEAVEKTGGSFTGLDIFMILFTILIAAGVYRLIKQEKKNLFAIGFGTISLLTFLLVDLLMMLNWFGLLEGVQEQVAKFM